MIILMLVFLLPHYTIIMVQFIRKWTVVMYHKSQLRAERGGGAFELGAILKVVK